MRNLNVAIQLQRLRSSCMKKCFMKIDFKTHPLLILKQPEHRHSKHLKYVK
jgi:hypothetical protein